MSQQAIQSINAENLPIEEYNFVKSQQAIYELCLALQQDEALKSQLETAKNPDNFIQVAAELGYDFTVSDLEFAMRWALEKTDLDSDEFDDYELSEEDLEAVAGGVVYARAMSNNSYWHDTGILVNQQCFHLLEQSTDARSQMEVALETMELWKWKGNNTVEVFDLDGKVSPYTITGIAYDGLALSLLQNTSGKETYSNGLTGILL
ncbi:Nif11-like leader peptide family RiPP precursor [Argonema galeatum]|uniref:Nif11-like leader peptide family RiPP precursor n=1 Tax=Argonema galeatum TaxID=2942762 RepID=UPI0020131979|nr:Nif11-like leader peptide family RiPP precursor [Argonema galeatum]MCL1467463.1 Nif11-like leader peptide family RiPP precursor [Argonema galeatum A003/A1]